MPDMPIAGARRSSLDPRLARCLLGVPTVGDYLVLCEENYCLLNRLVPGLRWRSGADKASGRDAAADLRLDVLEQARYTSLVRLTHVFSAGATDEERGSDPDALLRAYHDARQVEVIELRQTAMPIPRHYQAPALAAKWKINWFLRKWLNYCLVERYRFVSSAAHDPPTARPERSARAAQWRSALPANPLADTD